jgi:hypothetical protein
MKGSVIKDGEAARAVVGAGSECGGDVTSAIHPFERCFNLATRLVVRAFSAAPLSSPGGGLLSDEAQAAAGPGVSRSVTPGSFLWFMDFKHPRT